MDDPFQHEIKDYVKVEQAKSPHRHRIVRHNYEPRHGERVMEVVVLDKGEPGHEGERIVIADVAGDMPYPYSTPWGDAMTVDQALRLAQMIETAAYTLINEREAAKVAP